MMKKRWILFFLFSFLMIGLVGCTQDRTPTVIQHVDIFELQTQVMDLISEVEEAVIGVQTTTKSGGQATGSGVVYKKEQGKYFAITNQHVVSDWQKVQVYLGNGRFYKATVIGEDAKNDLAVLTFEYFREIKPVTLENQDIVKRGQFVVAMGSPLGLANYNSVSFGIVSRILNGKIQHDAAINPGNSGGALFSINKNLIGINVEKIATTHTSTGEISVEGMGYAIDMATAMKIAGQIEQNGTIERPLLGVTVMNIIDYIEQGNDITKIPDYHDVGVIIMNVEPESAAEKNGLKPYDLILTIEQKETVISDDVGYFIRTSEKGDILQFTVLRKEEGTNKELIINVTL